MSDYHPPLKDMQFLLDHVLGFDHEDADSETAAAILDEASKLARDVLAPINVRGDQQGASFDADSGSVTVADGFRHAYETYRDSGWNAVPFEEDYGGQNLPWALAFPIQEMWQGANMSFGLCPLLNQGAIEAISAHGSSFLKDTYLAKLISGEWTGTMNLTEPQAGSDLGLLAAKAQPTGDDSGDEATYRVSGQKIYITYGEHDMTDNIVHLVLARLPNAPDDVRGISLFAVPKVMPDGARNGVKCIGLEHKLGIHGSPTCTMEFDGAIGYLVGEAHKGLMCMFTMMNNARLSVGLQGVAIAERAYQHALSYAQERKQGRSLSSGERVTIDQHADVKRMLLTMRSQIEAGRALVYQAAMGLDNGSSSVAFLTPIVKSWCTDMAVQVASLGVQIHGGMGFIEETGAAQYYRDARILPIYEGTNGIQALDLVFRKIMRDGGVSACEYIDTLGGNIASEHERLLRPLLTELNTCIVAMCSLSAPPENDKVAFAATPFLNAFAIIAGGVMMSRSWSVAKNFDDADFTIQKIETAEFFLQHILPQASANLASVKASLSQ